jgi:hypothetical protein
VINTHFCRWAVRYYNWIEGVIGRIVSVSPRYESPGAFHSSQEECRHDRKIVVSYDDLSPVTI